MKLITNLLGATIVVLMTMYLMSVASSTAEVNWAIASHGQVLQHASGDWLFTSPEVKPVAGVFQDVGSWVGLGANSIENVGWLERIGRGAFAGGAWLAWVGFIIGCFAALKHIFVDTLTGTVPMVKRNWGKVRTSVTRKGKAKDVKPSPKGKGVPTEPEELSQQVVEEEEEPAKKTAAKKKVEATQ